MTKFSANDIQILLHVIITFNINLLMTAYNNIIKVITTDVTKNEKHPLMKMIREGSLWYISMISSLLPNEK